VNLSVTIPALLIAGANAYVLWNEHWAHWEHMAPLEERPEYPYQNLRIKNFFWGDGDKVSPLSTPWKSLILTCYSDCVVSSLSLVPHVKEDGKRGQNAFRSTGYMLIHYTAGTIRSTIIRRTSKWGMV
jgi:hypothetical protein